MYNYYGSVTYVLGADVADGEWCVARISANGFVFETVPEPDRVPSGAVVDIPIGLPEDSRRRCDTAAKDLLGQRHSTVFLTPVREAVYAEDYAQANQFNKEKAGYGISKQSWNLTPKIREIDRAVRNGKNFRESHPEVVFARLNGEPVPSKHTQEGLEARKKLLEDFDTEIRTKLDDNEDDRLDAAALALHEELEFQPIAEPEKDSKGVKMQILAP